MRYNELITMYRDIAITYNEKTDLWEFVLRGRSRAAETLRKVREAIDRPVKDKKDAKTFVAKEAYFYQEYRSPKFQKVTVTSIAQEIGWKGTDEVWISNKGERSKEPTYKVYEISPENLRIIEAIVTNDKQREFLDNQSRELIKTMTKLDLGLEEKVSNV